ncbi:hypothetical protein [uncultured Brachyspira sp.]|uniref:hypothetical protein n=1 Tax=uncultured Brachyspira sp. TaxID=221953 RepID=UPI0025DE0E35|nr:hypothetical protein [uncultured Brachyspira sp.]
MDSDSVYKRVNINKVIKNIQKNNADITESKAEDMAYFMIKELNKKVASMVNDFENGEGDFMACYFNAADK